ncbi:MAG: DUF1674 domain-containing protein [Janthinobacterium lividum]
MSNNIILKDKNKDKDKKEAKAKEIGGYKGSEPTRYGDWQHKGKTTDF